MVKVETIIATRSHHKDNEYILLQASYDTREWIIIQREISERQG